MKLRNLFEAEPVKDFSTVKPGAREEIPDLTNMADLERLNKKIYDYEQSLNNLNYQKVPKRAREELENLKSKVHASIDHLNAKRSEKQAQSMVDNIPKGLYEFFKTVSDNCSEIFDVYKTNGNDFLYRGTKSQADAFKGKPFDERRAKDSDQRLSDALNKAMAGAGIVARRDNSIFTSASKGQASNYGTAFIIFPVNGYSFSCSSKIRDFIFDASQFKKYFLNPVRDLIKELATELLKLDENVLEKYFPKNYDFTHYKDPNYLFNYDVMSDFTAIKKLYDDGIIKDKKYDIFTDINNLMTPENVVKNLGFFWNDIEKAIEIKHEVVIRGDYYAINAKYESEVRAFLNGHYEESDETKEKNKNKFRAGQGVEFIDGDNVGKIGVVSEGGTETITVKIIDETNVDTLSDVSIDQVKKIELPTAETTDLAKGDKVAILDASSPFMGMVGVVDYVWSSSKTVDVGLPNLGGFDFKKSNLTLLNNVTKNADNGNKKLDAIKVKELTALGKKQGFVTYADLNEVFPPGTEAEYIEDFIEMLSELGVSVVEKAEDADEEAPFVHVDDDIIDADFEDLDDWKPDDVATPAKKPEKTYTPSASKVNKFLKAAKATGTVTQAQMDALMPPDVTSDQTIADITGMLEDLGISIEGADEYDTPTQQQGSVSTPSPDFKPYKGQQVLTPKEKNAWEQIMIKSTNDAVVEPLLNKAFADNYISSKSFGILAKAINFPFWVAGKYLANAGVKVEEPEVIKKKQSQLYDKPDF